MDSVNKSYNVSWAYAPGYCDSGSYNITLLVNDSYGSYTEVNSTLTVVNLNRPPQNNASIENLTWQEDTNLIDNITLALYFNDIDSAECSGQNKDTITYGYVTQSIDAINSSQSVNISINQSTGNVSFFPPHNWFGVQIIAFYANDSYDITYSNNVTLNVTNVNNPPVLQELNNQTLRTGLIFVMQVNATDPDNDTLYFYSNSSFINITLDGWINLIPTIDNVGSWIVNISVNDTGYIDSQIVNFTVTLNNPPILDPIGDKNSTQEECVI